MQIITLSAQEQRGAFGATHKIKVTHADLTETATNTAQTIAMLSAGIGAIAQVLAVRLVTPFKNSADAALNTTTPIIGDGGSTNRFLVSMELNENGTEVLVKAGSGTVYGYETADTVDMIFGSMSAKSLVDLDTGEVHIFARLIDLDTFI